MTDFLNKLRSLELTKRLEQLKLDRKKIAVIILAGLILIYLDFAFLIGAQLKGIKAQNPKIIKLKKDLDAFNKNLFSMQEAKKTEGNTVQGAVSKAKKIITQEQVALLLQEISNTANKNEVKIIGMKPSREAQPTQGKAAAEQNFINLLIALDLICDYHRLGKFINDLENSQTFIEVQGFKIASRQSDPLKQDVSLVLKAYVKK